MKMVRQQAAIDEFLEKKIGETKVVIDPMFKDCEFRRPLWATKFREE